MHFLKKLSVPFQRSSLSLLSRASSKSLCSINSCESVVEMEEDCSTDMWDSLCPVAEKSPPEINKVTIIGSGRLGVACAFGILTKKICNEICFLSRNTERMIGEPLDLPHDSVFLNHATIKTGTDYEMSADSQVAIITVGQGRKNGESRLSVAKTNADLIKDIVPKFVKTSPNSILVLVTNPVDISTYVAWKSSGFPKNRVIGSGSSLDTARFRLFLSQHLGSTPTSGKGMALGKQEDSLVSVSSGIRGIHMKDTNSCEEEREFSKIRQEIVTAGMEVVKRKGYANWAVAFNCATITEAILRNYNTILPVYTCVQGLYRIDKEVCLSVPCTINSNGATAIAEHNLNDLEIEQLQASAEAMYKVQTGLKLTF